MKKYIVFLFALLLLAGCSSKEEESKTTGSLGKSIPFEIVHYEEKIAPIYESLVPHIAYAKTEEQLEALKGRFKVDGFDIDMNESFAVFVVTYSDGCGIAVDGMYDKNGLLIARLLSPSTGNCDEEGVPHTFVLKVAKDDYEKVQLYNGDIIKSSMDIKE